MLNKSIQLQLIEHADSSLRVLGFGANADHHAHHLLIDVLTNLVSLHALVIDLPTATVLFSFGIAVDQSGVADHVRDYAHVLPHVAQQVLSFLQLAHPAVG